MIQPGVETGKTEADMAQEPGGGDGRQGDGRQGERRSVEKERNKSCHKPSADTTQPYAGYTKILISFHIAWIRYPARSQNEYLAVSKYLAGWISCIRPSINVGYPVHPT